MPRTETIGYGAAAALTAYPAFGIGKRHDGSLSERSPSTPAGSRRRAAGMSQTHFYYHIETYSVKYKMLVRRLTCPVLYGQIEGRPRLRGLSGWN
jgi:hypothetical protein